MSAKSVLIIEDLDRIDPAHLFRIMNVLSSQVDNPYYSEVPNGNKFGFDKIILVMDYEIARHLFHHFYGKEANYEGYMNKFQNSLPYSYSIKKEAHRQVEAKLLDICKTDEVLGVVQQLSSNKEDSFSVPSAIMQMSVRRCKEFLDMDVCNLIRNTWMKGEYDIPTQTAWTKILACYRFLFSDRSLNAIQEMMLYGFSDLQLAELYAPYNYALKGESEFYMEYENDMYNFCYIKGKNLVRRGRVLSWQSDKILDLAEIRKELQKLNHDIRNLLLG